MTAGVFIDKHIQLNVGGVMKWYARTVCGSKELCFQERVLCAGHAPLIQI
jgi:hypothetical protein